ncbi:MAG: NADH-quinone oxidoreductase subunit L [Gammaproteobacteria bacterium]|nr:NADH-quinone oxidoreductase subunit L [Gammaproteobacteria bacterium]MBU0849464.1 NADH-quinone oxidoreductase subunit L [Gammaproteobacteria bacterium]MBU1268121.1 NADH-quinone oxidoreductase subunit L [Gammaproteobacteria bacterium]MBU1528927.1 NADH-quinone oxidoreductase subunit L [Gammaproteobacteria bacterium]MBU1779515.1 NADH-quinone oxidoreductase subunit L [Gammaproteobacteria bacterium]
MNPLYLIVPFAPLVGSILAGFFGKQIGRTGAHTVTIAGVAISLIASILVFMEVMEGNTFNGTLYEWAVVGTLVFEVGFLVDTLTATMMLVVTSVSLMVHIYTIGYMEEDDGYQRFFSYISLFTFSMLMLVMSNNFLQLFFGWEAVGLVSYLLIGFWYTKPTAIYANLKAFLVNRVGDFGFILGIGLIMASAGSMNYAEVFAQADSLAGQTMPGTDWPLLAVACICLFIGAMGKSAQFPLHVWLPDSMEGPTPISALIHAATMVTAGIFMVSRMSPLFELSDIALNFVLVIGSITALFMGFLGIIQNDIKRVVAYSTLSQLGYMTVALGVSAYPVAIFHLMTHAFFKALLFLGAGSVIIGMHHDQDIRHMGGLWKYMPITWLTSLLGSLALIGTPFFSGFYSKDSIIEAVHFSNLPAADFAYFAVVTGVFITAFYSFRMYFLVFHGKERFHDIQHHDDHGHDDHHDSHAHHGPVQPHESRWVVTLPLILLAIPSVIIGYIAVEPMLHGTFFEGVITIKPEHGAMAGLSSIFHGAAAMGVHSLQTAPFWLALAGVVAAAVCYLWVPAIPAAFMKVLKPVHTLLDNKYYMDKFNEVVFAGGARGLGEALWKFGDRMLIDGLLVNGSAKLVGLISGVVRFAQSGFIYHYAFAMILGVLAMIITFITLK